TTDTNGDDAWHSEQWVLCGLVRADRFRAESSAISYTTLLWFSGLLAVVAIAIPFVKLRALSARERLRASDVGWVTAMTVTAIGLLTLGALDVYAFGWRFGSAVDDRLKAVAHRITDNVTSEVVRIDRQGTSFESGIGEVFRAVSKSLRESRPRRDS